MIKWCKHCCSLKILANMFFLKHATESSFLISIGVLFHSLVAETAKERPPSVSLLYLGQTALMLEYLVLREWRSLFKETICSGIRSNLKNSYKNYYSTNNNVQGIVKKLMLCTLQTCHCFCKRCSLKFIYGVPK